MTTIILLAGGTASGKTTIVEELVKRLKPYNPALLAVDSYYHPTSHLTLEERELLNYDHPQQFDIELLQKHLQHLIRGESIVTPIYDYALHNRKPEGRLIYPSELILVEGIMCLHFSELRELGSFSIFVQSSDELRLERRTERDIRERGRTRESVITWWHSKVHPMHLQFCQPSKEHADMVVSGEVGLEISVDSILNEIKKRNLLPSS